ncbi:thiamine ABC transporter ATP-binding protein [Poseidonibacter antarcticus]|uniref:thiamine ABC transporter ATP-binding protein n=1 Tax=Poseidonibacter antarcticus TaxID=2478538 RepID=UPI000EF4E90D|nr:ATP-binding cassette domain-containing protein [Poseidonibacter antarcticus]
MLKIKNLQYKYKNSNTKETYTYNLEVKESEIIAILGQSGSGKSTLLDLIAGFIDPLSGSILLDQKELLSLSVEKRPMSILFQNHNLFEHLNVQKNILLGLGRTNADDKKAVSNILKKVGLEKFEHTLSSQLSGGQQQRVALARVLLRNEPILLLDEPFSGLDEQTKIIMLDLVKNITQEHKLHTIMVTHDMQDCKRIASKVYRMQNYLLEEEV